MKKTTNTGHRIIAVILAIMMLFSVMPAAFAAEGDVAQIGDTTYTDLVAALDDAVKTENEGCTVTLLADATLTSAYYFTTGKFTLDLNGKKIERNDNLFSFSGDVTIIDSVGGGSIVSGWFALMARDGHLTLGKADGTANNFTIQGEACALYCNAPNVTIYGGTYIAGSIASIWEDSQHYANEMLGDGLAFAKKDDTTSIVNGNVSKLTESVTVVSHTHSYVDGKCVCSTTDPNAAQPNVAQIGDTTYTNFVTALDEASKAENAGCTLTLLADVKLLAYYDIESKLTLDLNGKKIERDGGNAFYIEIGGDLTVIDSVGGGSIAGDPTAIHCNSGKLTLGKADGTASDFTINGKIASLYVVNTNVSVYGGTYIAGSTASILTDSQHYVNEILGDGLAFAKKDDTTSIVNGNVSELTESVTVVSHTHSYVDGKCVCGATDPNAAQPNVAQIGNTKYTTLVAALDDAVKTENEGCTVTLLADATLTSEYYVATGKFTLDLNGKKIEGNDNLFDFSGDVTIIDSVGGGSIVSGWFALMALDGHLTLGKADGTANNFTIQGEACALYCHTTNVTIYGGTYIAGSIASIWEDSQHYANEMLGDGLAFAKKDDTTSIVNGNVSELTESVTVVSHTHSYVDGKCVCGATDPNAAQPNVAQIGNTKYTTLVAALDDAVKTENKGCTVTLLADATLTSEYRITAGKFTLDLNGKKIERNDNLFRFSGDVTIIDSVGGGSIVSGWFALTALDGHLTLGKADGTANNFTIQGKACALYCNAKNITIYGGTYIAGSTASILADPQHYVNEILGDGLAFAKKDDTTSIVNGNVSTLTESVTVVNAEEFFAPKIVSINGDKPMSNGFSKFTVTLDGHVNKLQVIYPNGSTSTFNNYSNFTTSDNKRGVVSITAYDKDGNEVRPDSSENVREIWVLNLNLADGDYQIKTKSNEKWRAATKFTVKLDYGVQVDSIKLNGTANGGYNKYSVKVNGSAEKLKVMLPNGGTYTFDRNEKLVTDNSRGIVSIRAYDRNGNELALRSDDTVYEIWVLNMKLAEGEHTVKAKHKNTWEASGKSFAVSYATTLAEVKVVDVQSDNGSYAFKLNGTAQKLQIVYASGATCTLSNTNSSVSVKYYDANDVEVEKNSDDVAYEIWTVNKNLASGTYTVLAKYYNGTTHVWNTNGFAFEA